MKFDEIMGPYTRDEILMRAALENACLFNDNSFCSSYGPSSGYDIESNSMWVNGESPIRSVNFTLMSDYGRDVFLNRP